MIRLKFCLVFNNLFLNKTWLLSFVVFLFSSPPFGFVKVKRYRFIFQSDAHEKYLNRIQTFSYVTVFLLHSRRFNVSICSAHKQQTSPEEIDVNKRIILLLVCFYLEQGESKRDENRRKKIWWATKDRRDRECKMTANQTINVFRAYNLLLCLYLNLYDTRVFCFKLLIIRIRKSHINNIVDENLYLFTVFFFSLVTVSWVECMTSFFVIPRKHNENLFVR